MNEYLTMREVAERLKLRPQTIRRWVQTNEIPHYKIRKNVRFRPAEIEKWIEDGGAATKKPEPENQGGELFADDNLNENTNENQEAREDAGE